MGDVEEQLKRLVFRAVRMQNQSLNDIMHLLRFTLVYVGTASGVVKVHVPEAVWDEFVRDFSGEYVFADDSGTGTLHNNLFAVDSTIHLLLGRSASTAHFEFMSGTFLTVSEAG